MRLLANAANLVAEAEDGLTDPRSFEDPEAPTSLAVRAAKAFECM